VTGEGGGVGPPDPGGPRPTDLFHVGLVVDDIATREGPVRLELIERAEATIWDVPSVPGVGATSAHHLGARVTDLTQASGRVTTRGAELLCTLDLAPDRPSLFAHHRLPGGGLVELVDARSRPAFERWFAGGPFPVVA
jgi:hypothetical protein